MAEISGAELLVRSLRTEGVDTAFDISGDPMVDIKSGLIREGVQIPTFRHEQAVAMAAQAYGYVLRRPGVALVASGPAMTNAVTGLATAWANGWPLLLIGGSTEVKYRYRGDFQELPQVAAAAPFCKWSVSIDEPRLVPYYVSSAFRRIMHGRPGPVYLDIPPNVIAGHVKEEEVEYYPPTPPPVRPMADPREVEKAVRLIRQAERPVLLIGKGLAWSEADEEVRQLAEQLQIPFVPSPMGKGVVPDDHPLCFAGARTAALSNADLVILAGARFNWIFHFGQPPRFAPNVKVVQMDIEPSEIGNGVPATVGLVGDAKMVLRQILDELGKKAEARESPWLDSLREARQANTEALAQWVKSDDAPMNMYRMYRDITEVLDKDAIVTVDGEATMAVSRAALPNFLPRHRLDAGETGCMGVSVPYGIGAQVAHPGKQVMSINGDWAFGWNGFEAETAVRHNLPIVFLIANNNTIGGPQHQLKAAGAEQTEQPEGIRYDKLMEIFGGHGENVERPQELKPALKRAFASGKPSIVNVAIGIERLRKPQTFGWLSGRSTQMAWYGPGQPNWKPEE